MKAKFVTASDAMDDWRDDVLTGKPPTFFPGGDGELSRIEMSPKQITLIGGAPGSGKTAFSMQLAVDALRLTPSLRCVVCNIEMPPSVLLDRQLARISGISLEIIRKREIRDIHADRIDAAMNSLDDISDRLCFVRPPFDLSNVAATADGFAPDGGLLIVLDYIQRIAPGDKRNIPDKRTSIDSSMNFLRQFADDGAALLAIASVGRQKNSRGSSSYDGDTLDLASYKESGELEFGADDAFILSPVKKVAGVRILKHLKSRHGECRDMQLMFDGARQSFAPIVASEQTGGLSAALSELWDRTEPIGGNQWAP